MHLIHLEFAQLSRICQSQLTRATKPTIPEKNNIPSHQTTTKKLTDQNPTPITICVSSNFFKLNHNWHCVCMCHVVQRLMCNFFLLLRIEFYFIHIISVSFLYFFLVCIPTRAKKTSETFQFHECCVGEGYSTHLDACETFTVKVCSFEIKVTCTLVIFFYCCCQRRLLLLLFVRKIET